MLIGYEHVIWLSPPIHQMHSLFIGKAAFFISIFPNQQTHVKYLVNFNYLFTENSILWVYICGIFYFILFIMNAHFYK